MIGLNEDALICDMAEFYRILNPEALPISLYSTLACGLPDGSRIKMEINGVNSTPIMQLIALVYDAIRCAFWTGDEPPASLYDLITISKKEEIKKYKGNRMIFATPEDFEREWEGL